MELGGPGSRSKVTLPFLPADTASQQSFVESTECARAIDEVDFENPMLIAAQIILIAHTLGISRTNSV